MAKKSKGDIILQCLGNTRVVGVARLVKEPACIQKLIWTTGFLFGSAFGIYCAVSLIQAYHSYSVTVSMQESLSGSPYPDVTICNRGSITKKEGNNLSITYQEYVDKIDAAVERFTGDLRVLNMTTMKDVSSYIKYTYYNSESSDIAAIPFVTKCSWQTLNGTVLSCTQGESFVVSDSHADYHMCATFSAKEEHKEVNPETVTGLAVILYLNDLEKENGHVEDLHAQLASGVKIFLHPPDTLPVLTQSGHIASPGEETTLMYTPMRRQRLSYPYGECTEETNLKGIYSQYKFTQDACIEVQRQYTMIEKCGCISNKFPLSKDHNKGNKYKLCGMSHEEFDILETVTQFLCEDKANKNIKFNETLMMACPLPCDAFLYQEELYSTEWPHISQHLLMYDSFIKGTPLEPKFKVYGRIEEMMQTNRQEALEELIKTHLLESNFLKINILNKSPVWLKHTKENPAISVFALIGTLGGAMNLWIGISFLTFLEVLDCAYLLLKHCCERGKEKDPNSNNGNVGTLV